MLCIRAIVICCCFTATLPTNCIGQGIDLADPGSTFRLYAENNKPRLSSGNYSMQFFKIGQLDVSPYVELEIDMITDGGLKPVAVTSNRNRIVSVFDNTRSFVRELDLRVRNETTTKEYIWIGAINDLNTKLEIPHGKKPSTDIYWKMVVEVVSGPNTPLSTIKTYENEGIGWKVVWRADDLNEGGKYPIVGIASGTSYLEISRFNTASGK